MGRYNNDELSRIMNGNEAYDKAAAANYSKKTGMTETQCLNLMKNETWMTGKQAIEYGFANTLLDGDTNVQLINKTTMKVNGIEQNIRGLNIPEDILNNMNKTNLGGETNMSTKSFIEKFNKHVSSFFQNSVEEEEITTPEGDVETPDAEPPKAEDVTVEKPAEEEAPQTEELTDEKVNSLKAEFVNAERKRLQEIDSISAGIDADLVEEAKYGDKACDAKELAFRALQRNAKKGNQALEKLQADNKDSNANDVASEPGSDDISVGGNEQAKREEAVRLMHEKLKREGK